MIELLLKIGAGYGTWLVLALPFLLFAATMWFTNAPWTPRVRRLAWFTLTFALVVRLALPMALMATGAVSDRYLADRYQSANAGLQVLQTKTDAAAAAAEAADSKGWLATVKDSVTGAFAAVKQSFGDTFNDVVTLVTVFVLETVLLPIGIVLVLWRSLLLVTSNAGRPRSRMSG
jgi:hypothetical protein